MPAKKEAPSYNLTFANVEKLAAPATGRITVRDAKTQGLILVCTCKGTKSYYLYRRVGSKPVRVLLGHHPLLTPDHARERAIQTYAEQLAGKKHNDEKRQERRGGMTLGEVWDKFVELRLSVRSSARTIQSHTSRWNTCLEPWSVRRLVDVQREEVIALHTKLGKERGHTTANRAIELLRALFNFAADSLGVAVANPATRIEMFTEVERERFLQADEVPKFFAALDALEERTRDFILLTLWTGQRRWNVLSMRWDDVELPNRTWRIPAKSFKVKRRVMNVALVPEAVSILERRLANNKQGSEYVFPSLKNRKYPHMTEPRSAWKKLLEASGLKDLRIHDLRRTLGSWQAAAGASLPIIGKSLGHSDASSTQIYARLNLDDVRESVEQAAAALRAAGEKKKGESAT